MLKFIRECSANPNFSRLAPLSKAALNRREGQEFVLRFFACLHNYTKFDRSVAGFLNDYLDASTEMKANDMQNLRQEWERMLTFVKAYFPNGFSKASGHVRTPRIRFEAISVGTALALRTNPNQSPTSVDWLESNEFKAHMRSDASNSRPRVIARIEFVRDHLLGTAS